LCIILINGAGNDKDIAEGCSRLPIGDGSWLILGAPRAGRIIQGDFSLNFFTRIFQMSHFFNRSGVFFLSRGLVRRVKRLIIMKLVEEELPGGITRVVLEGRLDIEGAAVVDLKMNIIASHRKTVLMDLQGVSFLASIGLRSLVVPARAIKNRGGKVVLFGPNEMVGKVLKTSGIDTVIPVHYDLAVALAALQ
jgi:anti-sigma B factor antagonist